MLLDVGGWGVSECSGRPIFAFCIKENRICAITRRHAEPNINILLTRNLPFESDVRQWSHPLMIPLHCLWAKSNNRTHCQFECDVTWFRFCFDFVCLYARCGCFSIVCLRFHTMADWDSMGLVITQTRDRAYQTLGRAFSFLLNPQKLGRVFQRLGRMFWNKCSVEYFDQRAHLGVFDNLVCKKQSSYI